MAACLLGCGLLVVIFFCFNSEQPSLSETMIYDFGFDALCELYELCVAEIRCSWHSSCFLFFVGAFDLNRILMHLDMQSVSCRPQKRPRKRSQLRKWKSQRQMGSKVCDGKNSA